MPWKSRLNATRLKQQADELASKLLRTREALEISERHRIGLEVMLNVRGERIDNLTALIDRLRQQVKKLDAECERLVEMIKFAPPIDAAMLAPK